jgi:hypothetical protein
LQPIGDVLTKISAKRGGINNNRLVRGISVGVGAEPLTRAGSASRVRGSLAMEAHTAARAVQAIALTTGCVILAQRQP